MATRPRLVEQVLRALAPLGVRYIRPYAEFYSFGPIAGFEGDIHVLPEDYAEPWPPATIWNAIPIWFQRFSVDGEARSILVVAVFPDHCAGWLPYVVEAFDAPETFNTSMTELLGKAHAFLVPAHPWLPNGGDDDAPRRFPRHTTACIAAPISLAVVVEGPAPDNDGLKRIRDEVARLLAPYESR